MIALVDRRSLALALLALVVVDRMMIALELAALALVALTLLAVVAVDKMMIAPALVALALLAVAAVDKILMVALVVVDKKSVHVLRIVFHIVQLVKTLSLREEMLIPKFPGGKGKKNVKVNKF